MKAYLSHLFVFLLGVFATAVYYWAFVNPSKYLQTICDPAKLGYIGDWVLNIFFLIIPLTIIVGIVLAVQSSRSK